MGRFSDWPEGDIDGFRLLEDVGGGVANGTDAGLEEIDPEMVESTATAQFEALAVDGTVLFLLAGIAYVSKLSATSGCLSRSLAHPGRRESTIVVLDILCWTCLWFAFSVSLVVYNKWLLYSWEGGFDFPLTISMFHMFLKYGLSFVIVKCTGLRNQIPTIPRHVWWLSAVPTGIATALDVAASNASFMYVTVTFYTVVKSSSLVFTLFFSILYRLQECTIPLVFSVFLVGSGVGMASYGDTSFDWIGFMLILGAAAIGGFRWSLTQVLMKQINSSLDAILTIYLISPASAIALVPMSFWLEGYRFATSKFVTDPALLIQVAMHVAGSGLFAFAMIFVELELLRRTSSLTLSVISYSKQTIQIGFGVLVFQDKLTTLNIIGFVVTIVGMAGYSHVQRKSNDSSGYVRTEQDRLEFDEFSDDENEDDLYLSYVADNHFGDRSSVKF